MISLEEIENNIVDRVVAIMPNTFGVVAAVGDTASIKAHGTKFPQAFVVFESEEFPEPITFSDVLRNGLARWQVFVIAKQMRGPKEARRGLTGSYELSDDVRTVLEGFDPVENSDNGGHPLYMLSRQASEDLEKGLFVMLCRFAHETENN
jgi:hypothetical protein